MARRPIARGMIERRYLDRMEVHDTGEWSEM